MWMIIRPIEWVTKAFGYIGAWILAPLMLAMVYEVVARKFFDAPTFWAYEMSYMLMGASFMFGIAYTLQMRRHIRVDFLYDNVGKKKQAIIDLFGFGVLIIPATFLLVFWDNGLISYALYAFDRHELSGESAWNPVVWPFRVSFVIGTVLLLIQTVAECLKCVLVLMGHEVPAPEAME
jgi:TRAP-type mannitol/chloroaromatic compound transport system permease small subunit